MTEAVPAASRGVVIPSVKAFPALEIVPPIPASLSPAACMASPYLMAWLLASSSLTAFVSSSPEIVATCALAVLIWDSRSLTALACLE